MEQSRFIKPYILSYEPLFEQKCVCYRPTVPTSSVCCQDSSCREIASAEVYEECGYKIDPSSLHKITTCISNADILGDFNTIFYVEVDDSLKLGSGGGLQSEGEDITVIDL